MCKKLKFVFDEDETSHTSSSKDLNAHSDPKAYKPMEKIKTASDDDEGLLTYIIGGILVIVFSVIAFMTFIVPILFQIAILVLVVAILAQPILVIYDVLVSEWGFDPIVTVGLLLLTYVGIPIITGGILFYTRKYLGKEPEFNNDEISAVFIIVYVVTWIIALFIGISFEY